MIWGDIYRGFIKSLKFMKLIIIKLLMIVIMVLFYTLKFTWFIILTFLTIGLIGSGTMDFGKRTRR